MDCREKRKYKRLPIELKLICRKVGSAEDGVYTGCTVNVSTGGVYFTTSEASFQPGNLLKLSIPPSAGLLEFGGKISSFARVVRTNSIQELPAKTSSCPQRHGVALEFCHSPQLSM
jgi:hypothetical protein